MNAVATPVEDEKAVFQLDVEYQHAVKVHDVATIKRIHADDMILVLGNGTVRTGAELEENARKKARTYEQQDVVEGTRKRVQAYEGVVIAKRNRGLNSSFIVRKISSGEGVERTFQIYSPLIASIEIKRRGDVRRAKLYYLRQRSGKSARIKEKLA